MADRHAAAGVWTAEGGLLKPGLVLLNQLRPVDKRRLIRRLGGLEPRTMRRVDVALKLSLGLLET